MNTNKHFVGLLALLVLASLACGLINNVVNKATGGDSNMQTVSSLWSDVPQMDGLQPSQMDLPLPLKLLLRTIIGNLGRLNPVGQDQTTGMIDWIGFVTDKSSDDVRNFYTNERMTASGWDHAGQDSTCLGGNEAGFPQIGVLCVFVKQQENTQLAIITAQDNQTKKTNVFFLRLKETPKPVPKQ